MQDETFHQSISMVIFLSRIFALFPVSNIFSKDVLNLSYSWLSFPTIYATLILLLNSLEFLTVLNLLFKYGLNFHNSGTVSLFVTCLLEHLYFWRLATKWSSIMQLWRQVETTYLRTPYRQFAITYNMKRRIYGVTFLVLLSALLEHCMLLFNSFHKSELERTQCKWNITKWESLYRRERYHLYIILPQRLWLLPILEWTNLTLAYPRAFTDVFIMCVSIGLGARFHQLYMRINAVRGKAMPQIFWTEVRENFMQLKRLMLILNASIAPLILLAFSNNMYFICFQLFNSFQNVGVDFIAVLAFWFSLTFAIARTMLTIYVAGTVNEYTKKILSTLRDVPSRSWCTELQRFSEQLGKDLTAWSANDFFFITRKLILAMASTVVTYELMVTDVINKGTIQERTHYCADQDLYYKEHQEELRHAADNFWHSLEEKLTGIWMN